MHIRKLMLVSVSLLAFSPSAFAFDTGRCRPGPDLDGGQTVTDGGQTVIPGETVIRMGASTGNPASAPISGFGPGGRGFEKCELAPVGSGKWIIGKPGFAGTSLCLAGAATLALPGSPSGPPVKVKLADTVIDNPDIVTDNPDIPQVETGELDIKDTAKASAEAYKEAVKEELREAKEEHRWPNLPDPRDHIVEVIDWSGSYSPGSC